MDDYEQINNKINKLENKIYEKSSKIDILRGELSNLNNSKSRYNNNVSKINDFKRKSGKLNKLIFMISLSTLIIIGCTNSISILLPLIISNLLSKTYYYLKTNQFKKEIKDYDHINTENNINDCNDKIKELENELVTCEQNKFNYSKIRNNLTISKKNKLNSNVTDLNNVKILKYK